MDDYYTPQGYALLAADSLAEGHWFGGEPYHAGAECPVCRIPLLLVADLNCARFRAREQARLFHELDRLPLYYCWRCCAEQLSYRVVKPDKIRVLRNNGKPQGDDFPYEGFPDRFPRTPVRTVPILYETAKLLALSQEVGWDWLSTHDQKSLKNGLGKLRHTRFAGNDITRHQIGGLLMPLHGHEWIGCPNKECEKHKLFKDGYAAHMNELAVIHNDPRSGLPMAESLSECKANSRFDEWVQLVYWVCEECLTIAVSSRCD